MRINIPQNHPRAESLKIREKLEEGYEKGLVANAGLIAHGRGEAFDYLLGEKTTAPASHAIKAAVAMLLTAKNPVISVNGNTAALVADEIVRISKSSKAKIEVNLFYRSTEREIKIKDWLEKAGASNVLGISREADARIPELGSYRRCVDSRGIYSADVVVIPLEDGDRTEALSKMGKKTIAVDLNPLSRTAQKASITIVDNIVRALPALAENIQKGKGKSNLELQRILKEFNNPKNLKKCVGMINRRLTRIAKDTD